MTEQRYTNGIMIERKSTIDEHHQSNAVSARGDHEDAENSPSAPVFIPKLYMQRYHFVLRQLIKYDVKSVVDFGSAECKITRFLVQIPTLEQLTLVDLNRDTLEFNKGTIMPLISDYLFRREVTLNVKIYQGSITDLASCILGCDAVTMVEIIEHLYPDVLDQAIVMVFGKLQPKVIIITTPNRDFNELFSNLSGLRHWDHKFEWSRKEFQNWCTDITARFPYDIKYDGIGDPPENSKHLGYCSQAAIFTRKPCAAICDSSEMAVHNYILVAEASYPCKVTTDFTEDDYMLMEIKYQIRQYIRGQSQTNGEVITNSEVTTNGEIITNGEVTINSDVATNDEVTINSEVVTNGKVTVNSEVTTESQICNVPKQSDDQSLNNLHNSDHLISDLSIAYHSTTGVDNCHNHSRFDLGNVDIQTSSSLSKTKDYSFSDIVTPDIQSTCDMTFDNQSVCDKIAVDNHSVCYQITVDNQSVCDIADVKTTFAGHDQSTGCFVPVMDGTCNHYDNLVPVSFLMKQKKVLSRFQIDQFREYLQSHGYILSADLDYIVVHEEESLSSDDGDIDDHDSAADGAFCPVPAPHQEVFNKLLISETESWD